MVSVIAIVLMVGSAPLYAEEKDPSEWRGFRRVFVPADRPDVWPTNGEPFLPVDAAELQEMLRRSGAPEGDAGVAAARATDAVFYARYIVKRLIDGRACIQVSTPSGGSALIAWPTARTIVRDPQWQTRENEVVKLGTWGSENAKVPHTALFADRSGSLLFKFETPASVQSEQWAQFVIASPHALRRRFYIDLPGDHELVSDEGRVELVQPSVENVEETGRAFLKLDQLGLGYRRWLLSLGPGDTMNVRVKLPLPPERVSANSPSYREELTYSLTPQGIDFTAEFQFFGGGEIPETFTIELDPELHLVDAKWGQLPLPWQESTRGSTDRKRVLLEIPQDARDRRSPLRIAAWCRNPGQELRRLPQVTVPESFWSEGTVRLELADGMELLDLQSSELMPSRSSSSNSSLHRAWEFTKLHPQAAPEIAVRKTAAGVEASIGTSLELSSASTKAVTRLQIRPRGRSVPPRLEAEVQGNWEIDAVETSDASNFTDWYVDRIDGRRVLRVQLREPTNSSNPIEVAIEAHAPRSAAVESLPLAELMPIDWRPLDPSRHVLAVTVIESLDLQIDGQVRRLSFDDLIEQDWELLQNADVDVMVLMNEADLSASLRLLPQRPTLEAEVQLVADVQPGIVNHEATIQLAPLRIPASKVRVQFTPAATSEVKWIDADTAAQLPAVRVSNPEQDEGLGELWEVQLASVAVGSQSFQAKWTSELAEGNTVPLVALLDAAKQRATISIVGARPEELNLVPTGLIQHPLAGQFGRKPMAMYRYDPSQLLRDASTCSLALGPQAAGVAIPRAVIERANLESKYPPNQDSIHRAEFVLEGATTLRCQLPDGARLQRVTWDGQPLNVEAKMGSLQIEPPADATSSSHTLQIDFAVPQPSLHDGMYLAPAFPDLGPPLSMGKWTLQLPDSMQLATTEFIRSIEPGWRGRLVGNWLGSSTPTSSSFARGVNTPLGWKTWELDFAGTLPSPVRLLEFRKRQALAYGVGLVVACLTAWQLVGRPSLLGVLLIVAALASIWLPPTNSMFATASWLGMLLGVAWIAIVRQLAPRRIAKRDNATTLSMPYATASLAMLLALLAPSSLSAQNAHADAPEEVARRGGDVVDVLIPVDERGARAGTRHYVPARFWEELLRTTRQKQGERGGDWVLLRGRYQGELRRDSSGDEVHASVWTLSWEVETLKRKAHVWLPLRQRDGKWEPNASIDGIPAEIAWASDGEGCEVVVREPGPHRIAVRVEPTAQNTGSQTELRLRLPELLDAELSLIYPSEIDDLQLFDGSIPTPLDTRRSKAVFALPMSDHFALSWRSQGQSATTASAWQVDQLELLSINPSGAELKLRLFLQGSGSPPAEVALRIDEMLEPLEVNGTIDGSRTGRLFSIPVRVEEVAGDSNRATAEVSFLLPRGQLLGNYRFPQVEVAGLVTRSRVAAVSLSDQFSYETMKSPIGESIEASAFASLWEDSLSTYAAAHRILGDQSPWTFSVHPRIATSSPEESLVLVCGSDEVEISFQTQTEASGFPIAKQILQIPPELRIKELKFERSIGREPVRWTRPAPDRLIVFFSEPVDEYFRMSLVGTLSVLPGREYPIPRMTSRPGEQLPQRVQIHRRPECLVEISTPESSSFDTELRGPGLRGGEVYAVAAFTDRLDDLAQVTIRTSQNKCRYSSQALTWFDPEVGVVFEGRLKVARGILDHVILEVPAEWIGPLEITPSAQVGELGENTPGRRQVKIQFAQPVASGERVDLQFSGSVAAARDGSWRAPIVLLADARNSTNYLAIPGDLPASSKWSIDGVVELDAAPAFVREAELPAGARIFRVRPARRRDFAVRRLPDSEVSAMASLALADAYVREDSTGSRIQSTHFFLPPITQRELLLEWPPDCEPIGVYLENRLLTPMPIAADRWRLPIGPTDLPVVLTAVSRTGTGELSTLREFRRPQLWQGEKPYELPLTLWTIESPRADSAPFQAAGTAGSVAEHRTLRLARLAQLLSIAEPRVAELSDADRRAWKRLWMGRLHAESARLEEAAMPLAESSGQVDEAAGTAQARKELIAQVAQLLGRMSESEGGEVAADVDPQESMRLEGIFPVGEVDPRLDYFSVNGPQSDLKLPSRQAETTGAFPRIALTFVLVAALGAMLRWAPNFDVTSATAKHPRWLVLMLGALWWAFLSPAAIGIALVAVATLTWAAARWQNGGTSTVARTS